MGISRTDLFSDLQNKRASLAKALAHPARIAILEYLLRSNECINSDLVDELGLAQATVSQHLRELKEVGLIQGTIDGVRMNYCINRIRWEEAKTLLADFFNQPSQSTDSSCC